MKKFPGITIIIFLAGMTLMAEYGVVRVDFKALLNLDVNGAGPLLVRADPERNRVVLVNTITSSVSIINGGDHGVMNIPIRSRIPQYLKDEALQIHRDSGNIYVVGNRMLHVVLPGQKKSLGLSTGDQYEMVAVNEKNGNAFLVGRASTHLARVDVVSGKVRTIPWLDEKETMRNLNQTPPPPVRKVVWDPEKNRVAAVDGMTGAVTIFDDSGRRVKDKKLNVMKGSRWHLAGFNRDTGCLYCVIETSRREVIEAVKIDLRSLEETVVTLPGLTEAVGVNYFPGSDWVIIPYDNHPSVHVVSFQEGKTISEIKIPAYGNDASAIDHRRGILYVSSWAYGEVNVIDLKQKKWVKRIPDLGIIPHMFSMDFNRADDTLYIPIGATAVNGSFGSAVTALDTVSFRVKKIRTGWAPVDLAGLRHHNGVLVFNSEDECARVNPDGSLTLHRLPVNYPGRALSLPDGTVCLGYGPHQSYWPVVYIWGARNGILGIDPRTFDFYDRRIPRLAHQMVLDRNGVLYALQNNWGNENQFLITLPDPVRRPNLGDMRWALEDRVTRETTQRILRYDPQTHWLYLVRVGEEDDSPGILQILDCASRKVLLRQPVGRTPVDLDYNGRRIAVANFDDNTVTLIDKSDFTVRETGTGDQPLKLVFKGDDIFLINHNEKTLEVLGPSRKKYGIPGGGRPDNLFDNGSELIITSHCRDRLHIHGFSLKDRSFSLIHRYDYPFGETTLDTNNTAFFVRGQFGDGLFELNRILKDRGGRVWVTDFLSGMLFILSR